MQIHQLKRTHPNKKSIQVGRGGTRGKTSGKGHKGQNARSGNSGRPEIRDMIKKIPKLRGRGKNINRAFGRRAKVISLDILEQNFNASDTVSPLTLFKKGLLNKTDGKLTLVKILSTGKISKKLNIKNCLVSKKAKESIEKAGGKVQ
jgi:large subunit ribosomal protein L15